MKLNDIINYVQGKINMSLGLGNLSPELQDKILKRQRLCLKCPALKFNQEEDKVRCSDTYLIIKNGEEFRGCGCPFPDLTFAPDKQCPLEKW